MFATSRLSHESRKISETRVGEIKLHFQVLVVRVLVRYDIHDARLSAATEIEPVTRLLGIFPLLASAKQEVQIRDDITWFFPFLLPHPRQKDDCMLIKVLLINIQFCTVCLVIIGIDLLFS